MSIQTDREVLHTIKNDGENLMAIIETSGPDTEQNRAETVEKVPAFIDFTPNKPQEAFLTSFRRFNIFECHRGAGKSYIACMVLILASLSTEYSDARYALISPEAKQGERNMGDMLAEMVSYIPNVEYLKSKGELRFPNGAKIFLLGLASADRIRGTRWDGIVIDEFRNLKNAEEAWNSVLRPSLERWADKDRKGWVVITTTPPSTKHYYLELYRMAHESDEWSVLNYPVTKSGVYTEEEIEQLKQTMSPTAFEIEYMCSHSIPVEGAYYSECLIQARKQDMIRKDVAFDPSKTVYVSIDDGKDGTCFWFAQKYADNDIRFIDFHLELNHSKKHADFINVLRSKPYVYEFIYLPHDSVKTGSSIMVPMAKQYKRIFGHAIQIIPRSNVLDGIQLVKTEFHKFKFNSVLCSEGLLALQEYAPRQTGDKTAFTDKPIHNWASHPADSLRYMVQGLIQKPFNPRIDRFYEQRTESSYFPVDEGI